MLTERFLRTMAWERAKGELMALLQTFCGDNAGKGQFEAMSMAVNEFVQKVEQGGLHE